MQPASTTPVQTVLETIRRRWGSGALVRGNEATGSRTLIPSIADRQQGVPEQLAPLRAYLRRGQIVEISGGPSSGKTALAQALLGLLAGPSGLSAMIDSAGTFYPPSAAALGIILDHLWIVHPPDWSATLNAAELLLRSGVLRAVLWDLVGRHPPITGGQLQRLRTAAALSDTTLLLLTSEARSCRGQALDHGAAVRLVVHRRALLFERLGRQRLLTGFETEVEVARAPGKPATQPLALTLGSGFAERPEGASRRSMQP